MQSDKIRVGIVGLGLVSSAHLKGYESHPRAEIVAVCDTDAERVREFAKIHGIAGTYTSYEEMLRHAAIGAVDIATPTHLHAQMTRMAVEAGKHVHCEKPFSRTVAEGLEATEAAAKAGVKLAVGETYVFVTPHVKARELIDQGEIGRPMQIRHRHGAWVAREQPAIPVGPLDRGWRIDPEQSGGGAYPWIFDHAVHFFAAAEYFASDARIAEVYSLASRVDEAGQSGVSAPHDPYAKPEQDIPIVTWTYENSAMQGAWMRAEPLNGKFDFMRGFSATIIGETGAIEVLGEGGHGLVWNGIQQHLVLHRSGKETVAYRFDESPDDIWQSDISYYSQGHINQVHHFVDSIVNDTQPRYDGAAGTHAVRCTLATIRSAQESRPIKVSDIEPSYAAYG